MIQPSINVTTALCNEETVTTQSIRILAEFLASIGHSICEVVIADNSSSDRRLRIARRFEADRHTHRILRIEAEGRGARRPVWDWSNQTAAQPRTIQ